MHFTEAIRRRFGWCPNETRHNRPEPVQPESVVGTAYGSRSFKARAMNWLSLFRNQIILLALYFSVVGVLLSVFLGGIDIPMFFIGIVAGSMLSVFQGIRFWKTMNEVRECGAVFLATLYDKTTITIILIVAMIPTVIFLGAVPGITLTMLNSITGGFIFIMFWWVLLMTWIWESRTHRRLLSDGLMLTMARNTR
jgi:hypothetical protein